MTGGLGYSIASQIVSRDSGLVRGGIVKRQHHILRAIFNRANQPIPEDCMKDCGVKIVRIKMTFFRKNSSQ
jgi:hypothetical protein